MPHKVLAVVSVLGKDQKGVVAQFATYMAERGINIEDIEQRVVRGFFVMDMLVDLADLSTDLSELITGLLELGKSIDMEVRVHLHSQRKPKKLAILVSKEPHCLQQLIRRSTRAKAARADRRRAWRNHPDLEPIARDAGLPFAWHLIRRSRGAFQVAARNHSLQSAADLVVLARYMRILPPEIVARVSAAGSSTFIRRCCPTSPAPRRTSRRTKAACASTAAPPISSPSNSTKARSSCRMSSTSTSASIRWMM